MKASKRKEIENDRRERRRFLQLIERLDPWDQFVILQRIRWMVFKHNIRQIPIKWMKLQLDLEDDLKRFGMPRRLHWQLIKWLNRQPYPDIATYFMCNGKKIWHHYFLEKYNFEFHLRYKNELPGLIWFKLKRDGTAEVLSFNIRENFRNNGLGTYVFQESIKLLQDRVTCIKGVLKKKYHPEPEVSLRWLLKQGFEISQKKNGDHEFKYFMNK